jgi:hypothetical protein
MSLAVRNVRFLDRLIGHPVADLGRVMRLAGVDVKVRSSISGTERCRSRFVKSFGRRLAYESPRGTNPRCVVRGLWGFEELCVLKVRVREQDLDDADINAVLEEMGR